MQKQQRQRKGMRRIKHEPPKVWHNPDVVTGPRHAKSQAAVKPDGAGQKVETPEPPPPSAPAKRRGIVAAAGPETDPKVLERERLIARLAGAEGRPAITRAADALLQAGIEIPGDQTILLQMLEHSREEYVRQAIDKLRSILGAEPCKRQTVLESRLRRLEAFADEAETRNAARELWRQVTGRASA